MSNVYVSLAGGLGNQLFQIAAGYGYAKKYNKNLVLDCSGWSASQGNNPKSYQHSFLKNFKFGSPILQNAKGLFELRFNYEELPYHEGNVYLHGYRQSIKYFEDAMDFVDQLDFENQEKNLDLSFLKTPNVAVHVRRGDYLRHHRVHLICGTEYFKYNIAKFPDHQINIFTDSPDFVSEEFKGMDVNIINSSSEINDLYLMSMHDNIIASNSSFSWWASLLNKKKEKIIVPKIWFKDFEEHHDIYRNDFIVSEI